jgi:flagellar biosynthetic protein FlhB
MPSGQDKTEQPTWRRLRKARKEGQIAKSRDLTSAIVFVAAICVLALLGNRYASHVAFSFRNGIGRASSFQADLDKTTALAFLAEGLQTIFWSVAILFAVLVVLVVVVNYFQIGAMFSFSAVTPKFERLNAVENFKQRLLKERPYTELLKNVLRMIVAAVITGSIIWKGRVDILRLSHLPPVRVVSFISGMFLEVGLKVGVIFVIIGAADLVLQRKLHLKDLKMTKQEVKEDYNEMFGNPLIKNASRRVHREILRGSIAQVKNAHVVVTNPTHLAVALKYEAEEMNAPQIVAKGADLVSARIRAAAEEAHIPIIQNPLLARSLFELEIDEEVPESLYEAVAEVLRWVYQMSSKAS